MRSVVAYSGDVNWKRTNESVSIGASYDDYGVGRPSVGTNITGSFKLRQIEWQGRAEITSGDLFSADSRFWTDVALPITRDLALVVGVEYTHWDNLASLWGADSELRTRPWRGTFGIRRKLTFPLSFLRNPGGSATSLLPESKKRR